MFGLKALCSHFESMSHIMVVKKFKTTRTSWFHSILAILVFVGIASACTGDSKSSDRVVQCSQSGAFASSQLAVMSSLRSPTSAAFPSSAVADGVSIKELAACTYQVHSWVDSQSSSGEISRTNYSVLMTYSVEEKLWRGTKLEL